MFTKYQKQTGSLNLSRFFAINGIICFVWLTAFAMGGQTHYVATNGASVSPYTDWATAATNIKWAVDAANSNDAGDIVIISNGTYYLTEAIVVSNAVVTNYSGDRTKVIVNGNSPTTTNRCFMLRHANAVLSGLTITNGVATTNQFPELNGSGGGVCMSNGIVRDCLITGCRAEINATHSGGGGIYGDGNAIVDSCSIIGNVVKSLSGTLNLTCGGAGVFFQRTLPCLVTNSIIAWNTCVYGDGLGLSGGGVLASQASSVSIKNCTIVSNTATSYGGGVYTRPFGVAGEITDSTIAGNTPGGIFIYGEGRPAFIRNCLIANNLGSIGNCAGISCLFVTPPPIDACTIVSNSNAGLYYWDSCTGTKTNVSNCIIYYNGGGLNLYDGTGGLLTTSVMYSCVAPGSGFTIDGVVTNEPSFVNMAAGNYRLNANSPCIDRGTNISWMTNSVDLGGSKRIFHGTVDMGAYEYSFRGTIFSVR